MKLLSELKNRRVFSTAALYIPAAWLGAEIILAVFDRFGAPVWAGDVVVVLFLLGFPVVLLLSWLFDVTAQGVRRASPGTPLGIVVLLASGLFLSVGAYVSYQVFSGRYESIRLAVLPLQANSLEADTQPYGAGIADSLRNSLRGLPSFSIPARTSSEAIVSAGLDIPGIAARLGVEYVLEGSLERIGNRLNVAVTLLDENGQVLWSESYQRAVRELFSLQNELARAVALQLGVGESNPVLQAQIQKPPPTNDPEAHRLYLQGKYAPVNDAEMSGRLESLKAARERDPGYAQVYPAIASNYAMACWGLDDRTAPSCELAITFAQQGLELDPSLAEAWAVLALVHSIRYEWEEALDAINRFEALPNNQVLSVDLPSAYLNLGMAQQAWNHALEFYDNDPLNFFAPTILAMWGWYCLENTETTDFYSALADELVPVAALASWPETRMHRVPLEQAVEEARQSSYLFDIPPDWAEVVIPVLYDPSLAEAAAIELDALHAEGRIRTAQYWSLLPSVQRYDQFVEMSFDLYDQKVLNPVFLLLSVPGSGEIRSHPRYIELMEYVGLAEFWDEHGWPPFCPEMNGERACSAGPSAQMEVEA